MADIRTNLSEISDEYTVFEEDQVLTHTQLNGVVDYLVDQERLTRVDLLGVGILCGLSATLSGKRVRIDRGVGVTTDGDLVRVASDLDLTHYRRYDDTAPAYDKLVVQGVPVRSWLLLPADSGDLRAAPLSEFEGAEGVPLASLSAALLVESVCHDDDLCSGTDCDNRGQRAIDALRPLLLGDDGAAALSGGLATARDAAAQLDVVVADRPQLGRITTTGELASAYGSACLAILAKLEAALPKLHAVAGEFLWQGEADPTLEWPKRLRDLQAEIQTGSAIQYQHDHLKDIVETYAALSEALSGDVSVCVPDVGAFPKHLLLGRIAGGSAAEGRTRAYPSALVRAALDRLAHARFLARKLDTLLSAWKLPTSDDSDAQQGVRITPSVGESQALEERAIPYYYDPGSTPPIHERWSFALSRRQMSRHNLSYHAPAYGGLGEAARPLETSLGRCDFFRVEGHLGRQVDDVIAVLESTIRRYGVPVTLAAALLPSERSEAPDQKNTELIDAYNSVRGQLDAQAEQVENFTISTLERIGAAATPQRAKDLRGPLLENAGNARKGLKLEFEAAEADPSWRLALDEARRLAVEMRSALSRLMRAVEAAPFETFARSSLPSNLDVLREALRSGDPGGPGDSRLLFVSYLQDQPGLEHFAGAKRGATLLLVHDERERVVADFMLPCCNCEVLAERDRGGAGVRESVASVSVRSAPGQEQTEPLLLPRGGEVADHLLVQGLRLAPSLDVDFEGVTDADCTVTLEVPFPQTADDLQRWGVGSVGHQPVALGGSVAWRDGALTWTPTSSAARWLGGKIPALLGVPRIDFFTGPDENTPAWSIGVQNQLVYSDTSSRPLEDNRNVLGGAAVLQRAASSDTVVLRHFWPSSTLNSSATLYAGLVYDFVGRSDFKLVLYEVATLNNGAAKRFTLTLWTVAAGIARRVLGETLGTRDHDPNASVGPLELTIGPERAEVTGITSGRIVAQSPAFRINFSNSRIGALSTAPFEVWELSDGVQSLQSIAEPRLRARLHVDRHAARWAGPSGLAKPFIVDFDSWFWVRIGALPPPGVPTLGPRPAYDRGLREEFLGYGLDLIV